MTKKIVGYEVSGPNSYCLCWMSEDEAERCRQRGDTVRALTYLEDDRTAARRRNTKGKPPITQYYDGVCWHDLPRESTPTVYKAQGIITRTIEVLG